ncbi:MAG TPA: methylated-DNA--[protein]-cysteine S-methyltransferase [Bryobacteraceae bacterium]|nr:methylated-DNA--[protein]-cysteine S-methyltransferase [Bryobacteraceae bacterium]
MLQWVDAQVPAGPDLRLVASPSGIRTIAFQPWPAPAESRHATGPVAVLEEALRQLEAYFRGELRDFDLPLDMQGTDFQKRVWRQLQAIPYGQTRSYSQIAQAIGSPHAVRAVGAANGANPIAIVVPCHRVIGASGKLVGYGGGLPLKKRLLELEGVVSASLDGIGSQ